MAVISKETLPPFGHAVSGSAGAMFALALVYPLDIIKTRIQVQAKHDKLDTEDEEAYTSAWDGIVRILRDEGLDGLYAGLGSSVIGTATTNFTYFYIYTFLREAYNKRYRSAGFSTTFELLLGAAAGALTTLVTTPISVITTRQQTLPRGERQSILQTCQTMLAEEGPASLWRGIRPSLVLCSNPAITYASFEKIKHVMVNVFHIPLTPLVSFVIGALSKTLATIVTYPHIMAKVRLQWKPSREMASKVEPYKGSLDVLARVLRTEGFFGWYKGMSTQISKAVLSQALLFMMKDIFTNYTILAYVFLRKLQSLRKTQ